MFPKPVHKDCLNQCMFQISEHETTHEDDH